MAIMMFEHMQHIEEAAINGYLDMYVERLKAELTELEVQLVAETKVVVEKCADSLEKIERMRDYQAGLVDDHLIGFLASRLQLCTNGGRDEILATFLVAEK